MHFVWRPLITLTGPGSTLSKQAALHNVFMHVSAYAVSRSFSAEGALRQQLAVFKWQKLAAWTYHRRQPLLATLAPLLGVSGKRR